MFKAICHCLGFCRQTDPSERLGLAAFGKHPGWDDHIDDIGLTSDMLVAAKRLLYVRGIAENIDSGAWEKLGQEGQAIEFNHLFLWIRSSHSIIGRLWSSSDGRGRSQYPMIVCSHCRGLSFTWIWQQVLPELTRLEQRCKETQSALDVVSELNHSQKKLHRQLPTERERKRSPSRKSDLLKRLSVCPELDSNQGDFLRILYHMDRESDTAILSTTAAPKRTVHIRVPFPKTDNGVQGGRLNLWIDLLRTCYGKETSLLMFLPDPDNWLDIIAGEPIPSLFFALRASSKAVPMITSVPYQIDQDFVNQYHALIQRNAP